MKMGLLICDVRFGFNLKSVRRTVPTVCDISRARAMTPSACDGYRRTLAKLKTLESSLDFQWGALLLKVTWDS